METDDGHLLALDARSGHQIWDTYTIYEDSLTVSPLVLNNTVYVAVSNPSMKEGTVLALDAVSDREKWSTPEATTTIGSLAVANGLVYIGVDNTDAQVSVFALNAFSGHLQWSYQAISVYPVASNFLISLASDHG